MKTNLPGTLIILAALACLGAGEAGVKPVSAVVIDPKSGQPVKDQRMMLGNIKLTFSDGHSEVVSTDGQCMSPAVSKKGVTGWIDSANAKLILRMVDGKRKEFKSPENGYPYPHSWSFADNDSAAVILWGGARHVPEN